MSEIHAPRCPSGCLAYDEVTTLARGALTYRQLIYWTNILGILPGWYHNRNGLHVERAGPEADVGSGYVLGWPPLQANKAARASEIIVAARQGAGGGNLPAQFALALAEGEATFHLAGGRTLTMTAHFAGAHAEAEAATT